MTITTPVAMPTPARLQGRSLGRSAAAILIGFFSVAVLSLGTDHILHVLDVYPPWGVPMYAPSLNLLALAYRTLYAVVGGYITAVLAPHAPMRHVKVVGAVGLVTATIGAIAAVTMADLGPSWYPIALALTSFHSVWLGGAIHRARYAER